MDKWTGQIDGRFLTLEASPTLKNVHPRSCHVLWYLSEMPPFPPDTTLQSLLLNGAQSERWPDALSESEPDTGP